MIDLTGSVVAVTGAGGGIGAGIARRLSAAGASVVAHTRTSEVDSLLATLPGPAISVATDLTEAEGPTRVLDAAVTAFGKLDGLVNNAALQDVGGLSELSDDSWSALVDVNLTAVHRMTRRLAEHLLERQSGGAIVHIASIEAHQPAPMHGHYAVTKSGVVMHARSAALEYGSAGIRVNSISPGLIDREGLSDAWPEGVERWQRAAPLQRLGEPEDIGDACVFLLSPLARWVTGTDLVVDGGVLARPTW